MGDKDDEAYAHAVNLADGKNLWSTEIGRAGAPGWGNFEGTRSTPTVDGDLVFVLSQYGQLVCLKIDDGSKVWVSGQPDLLRSETFVGRLFHVASWLRAWKAMHIRIDCLR